MIWEDECYLLSKRKFRENANIINIFTQKKGKLDGIVYGGTSRKIKLKKTLEFSFLSYCLISFPITLFGFYQVFSSSLSNVFYLFFVLIISFFATLLSLKMFFKFVSFKNILYFSIYCFFIGSLGLLFFFFS